MIARPLAATVAAAVLSSSAAARAQAAPDVSLADTLFAAAKQLRDSGKLALACADFAESKRIAPGIGVSLYLADCYERQGRTASAWTQFREAEALAVDKKDKRAAVARAHAAALEPRLDRLVIVLSDAATLARPEVRVDDGPPLSEQERRAGVPADPGDHVVTLRLGGGAAQRATVHLAPGARSMKIELGAPPRAPVAPPPPRQATAMTSAPVEPAVTSEPSTRKWVGYGLLGAGVIGVGVGAALLVAKNQSMSNDGAAPQMDRGAAVGSSIAFAAGGAAFVSAIVLYLTAPAPKESALLVAPTPIAGGGAAFLRATF